MPALFSNESATDAILGKAVAHHSSRNLPEAERLYRSILDSDPGHAPSLHNLGLLTLQRRNATGALPLLRAALEKRPDQAQFWLSYTTALMQAGFVGDAQMILTEAAQQGLRGDAFETLAVRLQSQGSAIDRNVWLPDLAGDEYTQVLERLHDALSPATYLEIGVQTGVTLALAHCRSIGIDPEFQFQSLDMVRRVMAKPSLQLFQMPSDAFFALHNPTSLLGESVAMAFLDGMHRCEFLLRDFLNTERHCRPDSVIALHDCLPLELPMAERSPNAAAIDLLREGMWTGDVWRTALFLKRRRPDLRMTVLDAAPTGLVLITGLNPQSNMLAQSEEERVREMMSWSLEEITLPGFYKEIGLESESNLRQSAQILARLRPQN